jgi:hypothetical protein
VQVDSQVLLDNLADALNTIDLAVTSAEQVKKPLDSIGIEESPELLNVLQRLMGASFLENPLMAIELTKLLPQILREQGIRSQIYRPDEEHSGREYFDFEPSIDRSSKDYVTITPALLKGDRLLRRGRVIEPAYSERQRVRCSVVAAVFRAKVFMAKVFASHLAQSCSQLSFTPLAPRCFGGNKRRKLAFLKNKSFSFYSPKKKGFFFYSPLNKGG